MSAPVTKKLPREDKAAAESRTRMANDALLRLGKGWRYPDLSLDERQALVDESFPLLVGPDQREAIFEERFLLKMTATQATLFVKALAEAVLSRVIDGRIQDLGPLAVRYIAREICRHPKRADTCLHLLRRDVSIRVRRAMEDFVEYDDE